MTLRFLFVILLLFQACVVSAVEEDKPVIHISTPEEFEAYTTYNKGVELERSNDFENAKLHYMRCLDIKPDLLEAVNNLGGVYKRLKNYEQAQIYYEKLNRMSREKKDIGLEAASCNNLGLVSFLYATSTAKRQESSANDPKAIREVSIPYYERAILLNPTLIDAQYNLGNAYLILGEDENALSYFNAVLKLNPDHIGANMNLGNLFIKRNRFDLAKVYHEKSLKSSMQSVDRTSTSDNADLWNNLGQTLREGGDLYGAVNCHSKASELDPEGIVSVVQGIVARRFLCLWLDWDVSHIRLFELIERHREKLNKLDLSPYDSLLMPPSFFTNKRAVSLVSLAEIAINGFELAPPPVSQAVERRLRIGYISYDMTDHPMGYLTNGLYVNHDRNLFEVYIYMYGERHETEQRNRINASADHFIDMLEMPTDVAAERIRSDKVDILIDLMAHTRGARIDIVAQIPAPTYVNYLGYPGTSGFRFERAFIMVDRVVAPVEYVESELSEKLMYLPDSYQANEFNFTVSFCTTFLGVQRYNECRNSSSLSVVDDRLFRFANFNAIHKLEPLSFQVWMNILRRVPSSVLFLLRPKAKNNVTENILAEAGARGVSPSRIRFVPRVSKVEHLDRLVGVDLFLDSFIYGAHSTASDALWGGVPVLTLRGTTFPSRVGSSLLKTLDLEELVVDNVKEFEDVAVGIGQHPYRILALKKKLSRNLVGRNLFATRVVTKHIETALLVTQTLQYKLSIISASKPQDRLTLLNTICDEGVDLQNRGHDKLALNIYYRVLPAFNLKDIDELEMAAQTIHFCGVILKKPELVLKAIGVTTVAQSKAVYYANLGHLYHGVNPNKTLAKNALLSAVQYSLEARNPQLFSSSFESFVHYICVQEPRQLNRPDLLRLLRMYNTFAQRGYLASTLGGGLLKGLDKISEVLIERQEFVLAAQVIHATVPIVDNEEAFRKLYNVGALYSQAGVDKNAVDVLLETVVAENKWRYTGWRLNDQDKGKVRIAIYCHEYGQTWWPKWGPRSPNREGVGGSEEAVIFLSKELVKLGYHVTVYADPRDEDLGITPASGGVVYRRHTDYDINDDPDVFVAWRYHISLGLAQNAKKKYLWLHDVLSELGEQIIILRGKGLLDGILGGSRFHVASLPTELQDVTFVLGYALQEEFFEDGPNLRSEFIYASAPNRGLEQLLRVWPHIHANVPNAQLRIYYGFSDKFIKWGKESIPNFDVWMKGMKRLIHELSTSHNVHYMGMVKHSELAVAYAKAGFCLYPTSFPETGCVSLMKAQAMGAIPITSRFINSSIPDLTKLWDLGPPLRKADDPPINRDDKFLQEWVKYVVYAAVSMQESAIVEHRRRMVLWAREELLWSAVAKRLRGIINV